MSDPSLPQSQSHEGLQAPFAQSLSCEQGRPAASLVQKPSVQVSLAQSVPDTQWKAGATLHTPDVSAVVQS